NLSVIRYLLSVSAPGSDHHSFPTRRSSDLLCNLHKRLCKALCELQIGRHGSKRETADSCNGKEAAQNGRQNELKVSDISDDRSHDIGEGISVGRAVEQPFIQLVKFFFGHSLMVEN